MLADTLILYSFALFSLTLLLPILPAVIIYRIFPDTKVAAQGPLRGLNIKTSGAFAAYVITVLIGLVVLGAAASVLRWPVWFLWRWLRRGFR